MDLLSLLKSLDAPTDGNLTFTTADIPGLPGLRLGRGIEGPALLIKLESVDLDTNSIELKNLRVIPNVTCRTRTSTGDYEALFTVCMCTTLDTNLQAVFVDALQCVLPSKAPRGSSQIRRAVESLIELFSGLNRSPETSVLGVWGEIFVIYQSTQPDLLLNSWHSSPSDHYDFAHESERLEVKSAVGRRHHSFSLQQLTPPSGTQLAIASVLTESTAAGSTVLDLITATAGRCGSPDAAARLLSGASKALGSAVNQWTEVRYDILRAKDSLLLVPGGEVPRPSVDDSRVWDVRFQVDLEGLSPTPIPQTGTLLRALAP